jgi:hypothetical protein
MSVKQSKVTVGITPTLLNTFADKDNSYGNHVAVYVPAGATVYLGGSDVSTTNGFPLVGPDRAAFDINPGDALYGVVASATASVNVLASGV